MVQRRHITATGRMTFQRFPETDGGFPTWSEGPAET